MSSFLPIQVLKGKLKLTNKSWGLRNILVVFQFTTSIILIIGTIIIYRQLNFIQTRNLGYKKEQVLVIDEAYVLGNSLETFKNEVNKINGVSGGTISGFLPVTDAWRNDQTFSKEAVFDAKTGFNMQNWRIDYDYMKTMGMELTLGRNFSKSFGSDSSSVIVNETAARLLGFSDPVGKQIYTIDNMNSREVTAYTIIGVVKNFNFESLRENVGPLCFLLGRSRGSASFNVSAQNVNNILKNVESLWKRLAPGMPFKSRFLDESFDAMYRTEQRVGKITLIFSVIAILIACLGLFGLATFITEQRTKEIGIRKVLGARVDTIIRLLSKDFIILVSISFVIGAPIGWYFMNRWLREFAYRIDVEWWVILLAGVVAMLIAILTVSAQAIKAALANPIKSLKNE